MKFLIDTNVFLEGILMQERSKAVVNFFNVVSSGLEELCISRFSLHSIAINLSSRRRSGDFAYFIDRQVSRLKIVDLEPEELKQAVGVVMPKFNLDFDDAFQYTAAVRNNLAFLTFDKDFDRTDLPILQPCEASQDFSKQETEFIKLYCSNPDQRWLCRQLELSDPEYYIRLAKAFMKLSVKNITEARLRLEKLGF